MALQPTMLFYLPYIQYDFKPTSIATMIIIIIKSNKIKYKLLLELQLNYLYYFIKIIRTLDFLIRLCASIGLKIVLDIWFDK